MNKAQLINLIQEQHAGYTKAQAEAALQSTLDAITTALSDGEQVNINNFGTFATITIPQHDVRSPATGEMITVPEHVAVKFRAYKLLKQLVNNGGAGHDRK